MKKLAICATVTFVAMALPATIQAADKVDVCHFDEDTGTYDLINISVNALTAHIPGHSNDVEPVDGLCPIVDGGNGVNHVSVYSAKFICGDSNLAPTGANTVLTPADYLSAINIHNLSNTDLEITKSVIFTEKAPGNPPRPASGQEQHGPTLPVTEQLNALWGVEWDCDVLADQIDFGNWAKGFLVIEADAIDSNDAPVLNVVGVYTSRGKEGERAVTLDLVEYTNHIVQAAEVDGVN